MNRVVLSGVLFFLMGLSSFASANGVRVGNGGDVVMCDTAESAPSYRMLDFYEAEEIRGMIVPEVTDHTAHDIAIAALSELARLDKERYVFYLRKLSSFIRDAILLHDRILEDIPDSAHTPLPASCSIQQIAIQVPPLVPTDPIYMISADLWDKLSELNRAGLMIHEIIYGDALRHGHVNSIATRYFTASLFAGNLSSMSSDAYKAMIQDLELSFASWYDEVSGNLWVLSDQNFSSRENAQDFCADQAMNLVDWKQIAVGLPALRHSYIGTYYMQKTSFVSWLNDPEFPVLQITPTKVQKIEVKPLFVGRALCFAGK